MNIPNVMVKHYAGSISYGTNVQTSDVDYRGIFCADKFTVLSPFLNIKEQADISEEDSKYYELANYVKLYVDGNPNVLETLWVDDKHIVETSDAYKLLRENRVQLLSSKVMHTFSGFAHTQSTRLKNHSSWISKEINAKEILQQLIIENTSEQMRDFIMQYFPDYVYTSLDMSKCAGKIMKGRVDVDRIMKSLDLQIVSSHQIKQKYFLKMIHNYTPEKVFNRQFDINVYNEDHMLYPFGNDIYGLLHMPGEVCLDDDGTIHKIDITKYPAETVKEVPLFLIKYNKKEHEEAKTNRTNYHTWKKNRNEHRADLEFKYGYDTKYAMHTIRILRMGIELLNDGELLVYRPDAQELIDIRNGTWTYEEVMNTTDELLADIQTAYENTSLPKKANQQLGTELMVKLREAIWYGK